MKRTIILLILLLITLPSIAQNKQETGLKREITLYNPYKPSLPDVVKKSYLPDMTDTSKVRPGFKYDIKANPFMPAYNISPIKPATLLPDPLPKLYNSYVKLGLGNYLTPLAEVSITNQRSKKGAIGMYARHFSTNGKVELQNQKKVFAGYMDNDASLFGRKFFQKSVFESSADFSQRTRYAYGYDTSFVNYKPSRNDGRRDYLNTGVKIGLSSVTIDSSTLAYNFYFDYNFFGLGKNDYQNSFALTGKLAKSIQQFYTGSGLEFDYYKPSESYRTTEDVLVTSRYIFAISPFISKGSPEWNVKLGLQALLDGGLYESAKLHIYPDIKFSFNIIPSYVSFFAQLTGNMEKNDPWRVLGYNPYIMPARELYLIPNTDYSLVILSGLTGETGLDGTYQLSASYSLVNDLLLFSNRSSDTTLAKVGGKYFDPISDKAEILNVHGEIAGKISGKLSFESAVNFWRYTLTRNEYAWNKPDWDVDFGIKYNLRNKILAGLSINATGKRKLLVTYYDFAPFVSRYGKIDMPEHLNVNLSAEYRYTKVLSFWLKFNNISNRYYEWAYYPSQRFICLVGFTYSL